VASAAPFKTTSSNTSEQERAKWHTSPSFIAAVSAISLGVLCLGAILAFKFYLKKPAKIQTSEAKLEDHRMQDSQELDCKKCPYVDSESLNLV
jgi:hypothetical protein